MRSSFFNSIKKVKTESGEYNVQNENMAKIETRFQNNDLKVQKYDGMDQSINVSFNLDKMYFQSDTSTQEGKSKRQGKIKKQEIEQIQVDNLALTQNYKDHLKTTKLSNQTVDNFIIQELFNPQINKIQIQRDIKKENQQQRDHKISFIEDQNPIQPVTITNSDQQVQVDFPQQEFSQSDDSVRQLSEIDMLFIFPENIKFYTKDHPLSVKVVDLAKLYPLTLQLKEYVQLHPQCSNENDSKIFRAFMIDWVKSEDRLSKKILTLAKMRTLIIRDAMNNLVDEIVPPEQGEGHHFRISKTYRSRYIKAGIPIPPPRVNNSYLQNLFSSEQMREYYENYVEEKLEIFLKEENYRRIEIYTLDIMNFLHLSKDKSVQDLVQMLEKKKKPFTNRQIEVIIEEARKIGKQYGKAKKRIGNGNRYLKFTHRSPKLSKNSLKLKPINSNPQFDVKLQHQSQIFNESQPYIQTHKLKDEYKNKVEPKKQNILPKMEVKMEEIISSIQNSQKALKYPSESIQNHKKLNRFGIVKEQ